VKRHLFIAWQHKRYSQGRAIRPIERKIMIAIGVRAKKVMDVLTEGLGHGEGAARKIDTTNGTYMPVCVERLYESPDGEIFSVAHYGLLNGDAMRDPDVEFLKKGGEYYPISFRNDYAGVDNQFVKYDDQGKIIAFARKWQADCASFVAVWMKNIKEQQRIFFEEREKAATI
jgi:hypothetical protein